MALQQVTLKLDEGEYEKLKEYLNEFGDPDITIEVVVRSYIRSLNRAMPIVLKSNHSLYNYFELMGSWLKHFDFMINNRMFSTTMENACFFGQWMLSPFWLDTSNETTGEEAPECQYKH